MFIFKFQRLATGFWLMDANCKQPIASRQLPIATSQLPVARNFSLGSRLLFQ